MSYEIKQSIYRLAANKSIERKLPPEVRNSTEPIVSSVEIQKDAYVENSTIQPESNKKASQSSQFVEHFAVENSYESYKLFTPGLEIMNLPNQSPQAVEMNYKGRPVTASFKQGGNGLEIQNLQYRGIDVGFFFKYPEKALGNIFSSVDNAVKFLSEQDELKQIMDTAEFDGSLGNAVIFSVGRGSDQVSFFATRDKIIKAKDISADSYFADLSSAKPDRVSYGAQFWSKGKS